MKQNKMIWLWLCFMAFCLVCCSVPGRLNAEDVIKIGVIGPLETPTGKGIQWSAEMAAEEINSQGGILGKQVKLILGDTKYKPEIGAYEYKKLAGEDKVIAVIGTASSNVALPIMEQMARYKVPFLPTGAASPEITDKVKQNYDKYKYLFRVCHSSVEIADFTSDWFINQLVRPNNMKRVAMMIESAIWTRPIAKTLEENLKKTGTEIPVFEYFYKETKDFKPIYEKIINSRAEAIFVVSAHIEASGYIRQWADMKGPVMAGMIASYSDLWKDSDGKALSVATSLFPGILGLTPADKPFHDKYVKKYQIIPEYASTYTYEAFYILKDAVERAKSYNPDAIVTAMEKTDYKSESGRWVFDKESHHSRFGPGYRQLFMAQWQKDGKMCMIWSGEGKGCDFIFPPWYNK